MSQDKMIDVFPVLFDYKKGEMPDAEKLSGMIKHINIAFESATEVIGDPWDIQQHSWGSAIQKLSLERLGIPNLSREIGPSDWISPAGNTFNATGSNSINLSKNKNSWIIGYPLIKTTSTIDEDSDGSSVEPLDWGTDIVVLRDIDNVLVNRKTSAKLIYEDGDFFVDFYKGIIISYKVTNNVIVLTLENCNMLPAGVPWATHNVIPTWEDLSSLCTVSLVSTNESQSVYTLSLPLVKIPSRTRVIPNEIAGGTYASWDYDAKMIHLPGYNSTYQLPLSLTSSMSDGDEIPEGFILIWDEILGRVKPGITSIKYKTATSLTLETPPGWLTVGSNYRVITIGTSINEAISYLLYAQRYDSHSGISKTAKFNYSIPLSHNDLENRYTDKNMVATQAYPSLRPFQFKESNYPTNPHPQYLHRYGYMANDATGNTGNAMRGNIVFAGKLTSTNEYLIGTETGGGISTATYGIKFASNSALAASLTFEGGYNLTDWVTAGSTGPAKRLGFGLKETGINPISTRSTETFGSLMFNMWKGNPLYIRGLSTGPSGSSAYLGGSISFDLGANAEMNYIKLLSAYRSGTWDKVHLPAKLNQTSYTSTSTNPCMPSLEYRVCAEQIREFRFRGVSYVSTATNPSNSLGGATVRVDSTEIPEFYKYYTSPAVVGADFFNVYGNALFFSETGDGRKTNFTDLGKIWMDEAYLSDPWTTFYSYGYFHQYMPTGLYYHPYSSNTLHGHRFIFSIFDPTTTTFSQPFHFGDRTGFEYASNLGGNIRLSTRGETGHVGGGIVLVAGAISKTNVDNAIYINPVLFNERITLAADTTIELASGDHITINATSGTNIYGSLLFPSGLTSIVTGAMNTTITGATNITSASVFNLVCGSLSGDYSQILLQPSATSSITCKDGIVIGVDNSAGSKIQIDDNTVTINLTTGAKLRLMTNNVGWAPGYLKTTSGGYVDVFLS